MQQKFSDYLMKSCNQIKKRTLIVRAFRVWNEKFSFASASFKKRVR